MSAGRDPGLQPERTSLAWRRTALSLAFNSILLLRTGLHEHHGPLVAIGVLLGVGGVVVIQLSARREREFGDGSLGASQSWPMWFVAGLVLIAAFGLCLSLSVR